jgi:hypothetical protein
MHLVRTERLPNTINGNARYRLYDDMGYYHETRPDSDFAIGLDNYKIDENGFTGKVMLDEHGKVYDLIPD